VISNLQTNVLPPGAPPGSVRLVRRNCPKCNGDKFNVHSSQMQTGIVECSKCGHNFAAFQSERKGARDDRKATPGLGGVGGLETAHVAGVSPNDQAQR